MIQALRPTQQLCNYSATGATWTGGSRFVFREIQFGRKEPSMKKAFLALATAAALATGAAHAADNAIDGTFGRLDHVFLIIMENQTNTDILGNSNLPFNQQLREYCESNCPVFCCWPSQCTELP
jgi:hypothetical protein